MGGLALAILMMIVVCWLGVILFKLALGLIKWAVSVALAIILFPFKWVFGKIVNAF